MVAEFIGQKFDEDKGHTARVILPLAAESAVVLEWAKIDLTSPSCIYVQTLPQERVDLGNMGEPHHPHGDTHLASEPLRSRGRLGR